MWSCLWWKNRLWSSWQRYTNLIPQTPFLVFITNVKSLYENIANLWKEFAKEAHSGRQMFTPGLTHIILVVVRDTLAASRFGSTPWNIKPEHLLQLHPHFKLKSFNHLLLLTTQKVPILLLKALLSSRLSSRPSSLPTPHFWRISVRL